MSFAIHMIWKEPDEYYNKYHFCKVKKSDRIFNKGQTKDYSFELTIDSAIWSASHNENLPILVPPKNGIEIFYDDIDHLEDTDEDFELEDMLMISNPRKMFLTM